jgi:type IV pilus assembly protein PilE
VSPKVLFGREKEHAMPSKRLSVRTRQYVTGFTIVEVMIVVAIIAILSAIAVPSYTDYVRRGKITEATATLANMRVQMEQYFQDNRTYQAVGGQPAPCAAGSAVPVPANLGYFTVACALTATTFTITATGRADQAMSGFAYTVNQLNQQATVITATANTTGYTSNANCWVVRKGSGAATC